MQPPPIAAQGTPPGPVADLLRLNTGVPPTSAADRSRLGLLAERTDSLIKLRASEITPPDEKTASPAARRSAEKAAVDQRIAF